MSYALRAADGRRWAVVAEGLRIGRGGDNAIALADEQVSRYHAVVWLQAGRCFVRDEQSRHGVLVNGQRISVSEIRPGDRMQIAGWTFSLEAVTAARPATAQPTWPVGLLIGGMALILVMVATQGARPAGPGAVPPTTAQARVTAPAPATSKQTPVDRAVHAAVKIYVPLDNSRTTSVGTGSVISERGYILTNRHIIVDEDTGRPYSSQGIIRIATLGAQVDKAPSIRYLAEMVQSDTVLDLALLRIRSLSSGGALPASLELTALPVGDSATVQIGDTISIIGFPGLGGDTVTLTRGIVSGFLSEGGLDRAWMKTDTELNPGNSGGLAINEAGQLVGIPTAGRVGSQAPGKLGLIRPISTARKLLATVP